MNKNDPKLSNFGSAKMSTEIIEKYQLLYEKDPNSKIFAPLAEAYIQIGLLKEAEQLCRFGVKKHPDFASGHLTYGKVLIEQKKQDLALESLKKAVSLAPENILAQRMLAHLYLELKQPKDALKAFKMVLFLNPQNETAKKAVNKLESLTADEYDDEVFAMTMLSPLTEQAPEAPQTQAKPKLPSAHPQKSFTEKNVVTKDIERKLSLVDAFLVRFEVDKALQILKQAQQEYGSMPEIMARIQMINQKTKANSEVAEPIQPMMSREQMILQDKISTLENLLHRVKTHQPSL